MTFVVIALPFSTKPQKGYLMKIGNFSKGAKVAAVAVAMAVGVVIALFQALTQIQEVTLTFVPKILAIFVVIAMTASFTGAQVYAFTQESYGRIESGFGR